MADQPAQAAPPPGFERKAAALLITLVLLVAASVVYVLYARGTFESTQELVLIADDSEGVVVGMDMTFSGFPIGRVRRIELAPDGNARIIIDVPRKDAHWLRESSVFTLVRGLVGNTNIRAFSGVLTDPPLPDGAVRQVLKGDATAEIPQLIAATRTLIEGITAMTSADSALGASLANLRTTTERLNGPQGALGVLMGNETDARKVALTLDRVNALLLRIDGLAAKTDTRVFGPEGVMRDVQGTVVELQATLHDARASLQKVDAVLEEARAIGANAREATDDLATLRAEVESSLRKVDHLINEVNRKWPFARDTELKLP